MKGTATLTRAMNALRRDPQPSLAPPQAEGKQLTALTFNTGNDFIPSDALIEMLRASEADVIGLQELSPRNAAGLGASLHDEYPHRVLHGEYFAGKALLSRYPIVEHRWLALDSGRPHIQACLDITERQVNVVVVHAPAPNYRRLETISPYAAGEIEKLLAAIGPEQPALLMGDFNFTEQNRHYHRLLRAGLVDAFRATNRGFGFTFPTRYQYAPIPLPPLVRIDYIWVTPHFQPLWSAVGRGHGSDHLPVMAGLALL